MSSLRIIGDVHGRWRPYKRLIEGIDASLQVGDMGVGFFRWKPHEGIVPDSNPPYDSMCRGDHRYIRGNHDNPEVCRTMSHWIPDGTVHRGVFVVGGAASHDREYRTEGMDWWKDEQLSQADLNGILDLYLRERPELVVTHDAPSDQAQRVMALSGRRNFQHTRTSQAFDSMLALNPPKLWIHGHHHYDLDRVDKESGTRFISLGELSYVDIDPALCRVGPIVPRRD